MVREKNSTVLVRENGRKASLERFAEKFVPVPGPMPDPCWLWIASGNPEGYGSFKVGGTTVSSHKFAYVYVNGPVPRGLELDHLCKNKACCNPGHLEPVSRSVNTLRGRSPELTRERATSKTHCPAGHAYEGDNLHINPKGWRVCRACDRLRRKAGL